MGGLGPKAAVDHSSGAYISSVHASEVLKEGLLPHGNVQVDIGSAMALLREKVDELAPEEIPEMTQKMISLEIDKNIKLSSKTILHFFS